MRALGGDSSTFWLLAAKLCHLTVGDEGGFSQRWRSLGVDGGRQEMKEILWLERTRITLGREGLRWVGRGTSFWRRDRRTLDAEKQLEEGLL